MDIKTYIETGEKRAGKQIELARILGVRDTALRLAKSGKKGLPDAVCIELANYIKVDPLEVIAASNLVTEKDERRRKVFESCLKKSDKAAASMTLALIVTMILTLTSVKPVQANSFNNPTDSSNVYYVKSEEKEDGKISRLIDGGQLI